MAAVGGKLGEASGLHLVAIDAKVGFPVTGDKEHSTGTSVDPSAASPHCGRVTT